MCDGSLLSHVIFSCGNFLTKLCLLFRPHAHVRLTFNPYSIHVWQTCMPKGLSNVCLLAKCKGLIGERTWIAWWWCINRLLYQVHWLLWHYLNDCLWFIWSNWQQLFPPIHLSDFHDRCWSLWRYINCKEGWMAECYQSQTLASSTQKWLLHFSLSSTNKNSNQLSPFWLSCKQ